jgi:hypothetical protein
MGPHDTPYGLREFVYIDPDGIVHRAGSPLDVLVLASSLAAVRATGNGQGRGLALRSRLGSRTGRANATEH